MKEHRRYSNMVHMRDTIGRRSDKNTVEKQKSIRVSPEQVSRKKKKVKRAAPKELKQPEFSKFMRPERSYIGKLLALNGCLSQQDLLSAYNKQHKTEPMDIIGLSEHLQVLKKGRLCEEKPLSGQGKEVIGWYLNGEVVRNYVLDIWKIKPVAGNSGKPA